MTRMTSAIQQSIEIKQRMLQNVDMLNVVHTATQKIIHAFRQDRKVLFCGNGGSAADAQHLAAELSGRFYLERAPLFAEALHVNTSYLTSVANDYSFDMVFERQVQAKGRTSDILIGISTSGNSTNVTRAMACAQRLNMITIGFTGQNGGQVEEYSDYLVNVPSQDTPRIQEMHILLGHIMCEIIERELFAT